MCGRYSLTPTRESIVDEFNIGVVTDLDYTPSVFGRYNIAPTQPVTVIVETTEGRALTAMRWGLIPQWMKPKEGNKVPPGWINARSETAASKPAFRGAYKYRRCVLPASGFYEWTKLDDGSKQPYLIRPADDGLIGLAGIWETWCPPDGSELNTVSILTTSANPMMSKIHERMPVILDRDDFEPWMTTPPTEANSLTTLLRPAEDGLLYMTAVSRRVNSPRNDDPACLAPLTSN